MRRIENTLAQLTQAENVVEHVAGHQDIQAGDTIKLFARVEDNDPAGPKSSESPVVIVTIINPITTTAQLLASVRRIC